MQCFRAAIRVHTILLLMWVVLGQGCKLDDSEHENNTKAERRSGGRKSSETSDAGNARDAAAPPDASNDEHVEASSARAGRGGTPADSEAGAGKGGAGSKAAGGAGGAGSEMHTEPGGDTGDAGASRAGSGGESSEADTRDANAGEGSSAAGGVGAGDPNAPAGTPCNTRDAMSCASTEFCNVEPDADCGTSGRCEAKPMNCDAMDSPVCGCDNRTYPSACAAHAAAISVKHADKCNVDPEPTDRGGPCGGISETECPAGQFCNYETTAGGQGCPIRMPEAQGVCQTSPLSCIGEHIPMCGCDQRSYGNACNAHMNGQSVLHEGACDQVDCTAVGGHVVIGMEMVPTCPDGESEYTTSVDMSGASPIENAICCTKS